MLNFLKAIFSHKHQWNLVANSYFETDAGIGMSPIQHCQVKCSKCNTLADKVIHPMYGTKITIRADNEKSHKFAVAAQIYVEVPVYESLERSVAH